jgi:hypothetical protein
VIAGYALLCIIRSFWLTDTVSTQKLMRRQKARQSDDFLATEWHRNHSNLDVDAVFSIDYMSR